MPAPIEPFKAMPRAASTKLPRRLLTLKEFCQRLGACYRTVWGLVNSGQLKSVWVTKRCVRVSSEALDEFERERTRGGLSVGENRMAPELHRS